MYVLLIYEVVSEKTYALIFFRKVAQQKVRSHATSSMMSQLMRGPGGSGAAAGGAPAVAAGGQGPSIEAEDVE